LLSPFLYAGLHNLDSKGHALIFSFICLVSLRAMCLAIAPETLDRYFNFDFINKLQLFNGHLCTFMLGYYLGSGKKKVPNLLLIGLSAVCLAVITVGTHVLTAQAGEYTATFQGQSAGFEVLLAACLFLLAKQNLNRTKTWIRVIMAPVVTLSLPIYLMHNVLLSVFYNNGISVVRFAGVVKITGLDILCCLLFTMTTATIKPLCYLINGVTYREACLSCNWRYVLSGLKDWATGEKTNQY
jgi:peptidoglycan/LPS O-acetylase OafA/YrhL